MTTHWLTGRCVDGCVGEVFLKNELKILGVEDHPIALTSEGDVGSHAVLAIFVVSTSPNHAAPASLCTCSCPTCPPVRYFVQCLHFGFEVVARGKVRPLLKYHVHIQCVTWHGLWRLFCFFMMKGEGAGCESTVRCTLPPPNTFAPAERRRAPCPPRLLCPTAWHSRHLFSPCS